MFGGLVCSALGAGHQSSDRRTVDDSAPSVPQHLAQLELHAPPHAPQIDRYHSVEVFPGSIGGFRNSVLNAGIVVSCIEPPESSDSLLNHPLDFHPAADHHPRSVQFMRLGGAEIGVALMGTWLRVREQVHSNYLGQHVENGSVDVTRMLQQLLAFFSGHGAATAPARALGTLSSLVASE